MRTAYSFILQKRSILQAELNKQSNILYYRKVKSTISNFAIGNIFLSIPRYAYYLLVWDLLINTYYWLWNTYVEFTWNKAKWYNMMNVFLSYLTRLAKSWSDLKSQTTYVATLRVISNSFLDQFKILYSLLLFSFCTICYNNNMCTFLISVLVIFLFIVHEFRLWL